MKESTIDQLKPGDLFSFSTRKNSKKYSVSRPALIAENPCVITDKFIGAPKDQIGKYLILVDKCRQLIEAGDTKIFIH